MDAIDRQTVLDSPSIFQHPQARRQVQLGGVAVGYAVQRARRRSVGLVVGSQGLTVRAPQWVTLTALDDVVRGKAAWVLRQLDRAYNRQTQHQMQRLVWADGVVLPYMGKQLQIVLTPAHALGDVGANRVRAVDPKVQAVLLPSCDPAAPLLLQLALSSDASALHVRNMVQQWFMGAARQHFVQRLDYFAALLGVRWTGLQLSNAKTRWGSARIDGAIRLNWRLMHACPDTIDYVVAHELAHLRFMNHSPSFWRTVGSVFPDYQAARQRLRALITTMWDEPLPAPISESL